MIVVDIETSGTDFSKCGIWQIGAMDFYSPNNTFLEESRIDDEDEAMDGSLKVTGKTEKELRDKSIQSQKELLGKFFAWCGSVKLKNCLCQNPQFDIGFMKIKAEKYGLKMPFHYRAFDLHSVAQAKHMLLKNSFLIEEDHSAMNLSNVLKFAGIEDKRVEHNALEDAKLTAEAFSRIVFGKKLLEEFSEFPIPEELK